MTRRARYLVLAISMVAGCGLGARPDRSRFFTLAPLGPEELATVPAGKLEMSLGLGPIVFPGYLDRMSVVRRTQANEIAISTFDRWAEPLREAFRTTLQQNLVGLLGTPRVVLYPWQRTERPELAIDVVVLRFEATETATPTSRRSGTSCGCRTAPCSSDGRRGSRSGQAEPTPMQRSRP